MNETLKVIRNRRSIRNSKDEQIKKEEKKSLLLFLKLASMRQVL